MDSLNTTVKPPCSFGRCGKPADVRIEIDYPATAEKPAFTYHGCTRDQGFRCLACLAVELSVAATTGTTVRATSLPADLPAAAPVPA